MTTGFEGPRTAIVTGGAKRIGAAFARALSDDGWHILIHCHRSGAEARALAAEHGHAAVVIADLADPAAAEEIMAGLDWLPPTSLIDNNAHRFVYDSVDDFTTAGWAAHHIGNLRVQEQPSRAFA